MQARPLDAVLFDLGNTLVSYYTSDQFYPILDQCVQSVANVLSNHDRSVDVAAAFETARSFDCERDDLRVWPLSDRLTQVFGNSAIELADSLLIEMVDAFLEPIFNTGSIDPQALPVLRRLREMGYKTAIVSNTPWGSPAEPWRRELGRMGLVEAVDEIVFCVDAGWRKPAPEPFQRALSRLGAAAQRTVFVGDDAKWDMEGAKNAGISPILLSSNHAEPNGVEVISELSDLIAMLENSR